MPARSSVLLLLLLCAALLAATASAQGTEDTVLQDTDSPSGNSSSTDGGGLPPGAWVGIGAAIMCACMCCMGVVLALFCDSAPLAIPNPLGWLLLVAVLADLFEDPEEKKKAASSYCCDSDWECGMPSCCLVCCESSDDDDTDEDIGFYRNRCNGTPSVVTVTPCDSDVGIAYPCKTLSSDE